MKPLGLSLLTISSLLSACATPNPFATNFEASPSGELPPKKVAPRIYRRSDKASVYATCKELESQGYWGLGKSDFVSSPVNGQGLAIAHAKQIGADAIIYIEHFQDSAMGTRSVSDYIPGTTTTSTANATANATATGSSNYTGRYGAYGYGTSRADATGNYTATQTTTTPGTFTSHVEPALYVYFYYGAVFYRYDPERRAARARQASPQTP